MSFYFLSWQKYKKNMKIFAENIKKSIFAGDI